MRHPSNHPSNDYSEVATSASSRNKGRRRDPYFITRNGVTKAVLLDAASYEANLEPLNLLKVIALANLEIKAGKTKIVSEVVMQLRDHSGER